MKFSELTRKDEIGVRTILGPDDVDLSLAYYDSRKVTLGSTFFAIKGFESDGHAFIASAIEKGVSAIVLDDEAYLHTSLIEAPTVTRILVKDSRKALAIIAEELYDNPSRALRMIGVTGTNGKTTVTQVIKQLLEASGETVGLIGTIGNWVGEREFPATHTTPESLELSKLLREMLEAGATTCVMEVSSHALALSRVFALDFDIAIFTNLTQDHLDFHKTMAEYMSAKQLLFNGLKDTALAVTNADSPYGEAIVSHTVANAHTFGILPDSTAKGDHGHADLLAKNLQLSLAGSKFIVQKRYSEEQAEIETSLIGKFNVENLLAAISALYFGVSGFSLDKLSTLIRKVKPVRGRFERVQLSNGVVAVIDYAHTPDALENVLETLKELSTSGKIITVFGCGGDRDRTKRPIMGEIAARLSDAVIITDDNPRRERPETIAQEVLSGIPNGARPNCQIILDRKEAIRTALQIAQMGDAVLIAGKGHETYQIFGKEKQHFDDREEVLRYCDEIDKLGTN
jgi:UDP-N-acetylmuramoyl-L-alanyl-D-glutamate--2,6-diaminopimelate ligase